MLKEEFKETKTYFSILEAISIGKTTYEEIKQYTKSASDIGVYLSNLERIRLISAQTPILSSYKSRKYKYYIKDFFTGFWFRLIYVYKNDIERGLYDINEHELDFNIYVSFNFEEIIKQMIAKDNIFSFKITSIGKWWHKDKEIDIVALNEIAKEIVFAECKWQDKVNAEKVAIELAEKSKFVDWHNDKRKEFYAVFAKSFSKRIKEIDGKKVFCFDLKDIEKAIKN